ncbi:MAG: hypothetical protein ABSB79_10130 [Syntrophales bacterium]
MDSFDDLKTLFDAAFSVSTGEFMGFTYSFAEKNILHWEFADQACFAYWGMKRMGVVEQYECGVLYRVLCWLDAAGVKYTVNREVKGCFMHTHGKCTGEVRFFFP